MALIIGRPRRTEICRGVPTFTETMRGTPRRLDQPETMRNAERLVLAVRARAHCPSSPRPRGCRTARDVARRSRPVPPSRDIAGGYSSRSYPGLVGKPASDCERCRSSFSRSTCSHVGVPRPLRVEDVIGASPDTWSRPARRRRTSSASCTPRPTRTPPNGTPHEPAPPANLRAIRKPSFAPLPGIECPRCVPAPAPRVRHSERETAAPRRRRIQVTERPALKGARVDSASRVRATLTRVRAGSRSPPRRARPARRGAGRRRAPRRRSRTPARRSRAARASRGSPPSRGRRGSCR